MKETEPKVSTQTLSYSDFVTACRIIAEWAGTRFKSVYGIPRGGLVPAVYLSHLLDIPLVQKPEIGCLVADDIADTGETLKMYRNMRYSIATIYYHEQSIVEPDIWVYEKTDEWIKFPWEIK